MIISGYDTKLSRVSSDDIELVRHWRNSDVVRAFMEKQEYITPEMQRQWFLSIDNEKNNYYIIYDRNVKIGLIYGAMIDWDKRETTNGGIFIGNPDYWETSIPITATFLLMDISFILGLERTFIKIIKTNTRAIKFNTSIGFELLHDQEGIYNQKYVLTRDSYEKNTRKLREKLWKIFSDKITITITDPDHIVSKMALREYEQQPEEIKRRVEIRIVSNHL